jgi:hypothetical protein
MLSAENYHKYRTSGRMWGNLELRSDTESNEEFDRVQQIGVSVAF